MLKAANNILDLVGNTPLVKLNRLVHKKSANVLVKMEGMNPGGSIKDRIALAMIRKAEAEKKLKPGDTIIEPTSGNTGIALALIAAAKSYKLILSMPENVNPEQRYLLTCYGATLHLTPAIEGMAGALEAARKLKEENPHYFMPGQFENPANPEIHRRTTAQEIIKDTGGKIDAFVAAVGTGGTITGVGEVLKDKIPSIRIIAVEPARSPVLSGGTPSSHGIPGIGPNFIPPLLNMKIIDEIISVSDEDALDTMFKLARLEGILAGISSGANVFASLKVAERFGKGKVVVTILPDRGERSLGWIVGEQTPARAADLKVERKTGII